MIRILLGQRGTLVRGALAAVLSREEDLEVVAEVARGEEVLAVAAREKPQVAVIDYALPSTITVTDLCRSLSRLLPTCGTLIMLDRQSFASGGRALARLAPQVGMLATETSLDDFVDGVRHLARGEPVLDPELAVAVLTAADNPLTRREREVLRLAVDGAPSKEIAKGLYLSTGTVRNYLSRIVAKTGARTRIEAIRIAQNSGWI